MLESTPRWVFRSNRGLTQWYGRVQLLPDHALGQWCCLDRATGGLLWRRDFWRANSVRGVAEGVIVADEWRCDGPGSGSYGCYGLSLATGDTVWTSHGRGWWGAFLHALDYVPCFANDIRDRVHLVVGDEVFCASGRVLDVRTGVERRRVPRADLPDPALGRSPNDLLFYSRGLIAHPSGERWTRGAPVAPGRWLALAPNPAREFPPDQRPDDVKGDWEDMTFVLVDDRGSLIWRWSLSDFGRCSDGHIHTYRYAPAENGLGFVYLLVSDEPRQVPESTKRPHYVKWNPTRYHLWTLDVETGRIVDEIPIAEERVIACELQDVDDRGLLLTHVDPREGETRLTYFARR